ncbi:MAG: cell division protein ZapA [Oscillospiraceae bacterium]|nr:cell division protein ZapA [Oscillospiraceae bacterium]
MEKCKVKVNICGLDYILSSDDSEKHVKTIVDEVSEHIDNIMQGNKKLTVPMAATLAALDFCDAAKKATYSTDNLREQIKDYLEDLAKTKKELEKLRQEVKN